MFVFRVDYGGPGSIFHGVLPAENPFVVERYCECAVESMEDTCESGLNVEMCDSMLSKL